MTRPPRTTESISRDNEAIRSIMHQARELTVPDRATLALGLVGNLATLMNRAQMARLLDQLREEVERVQDVPPSRQRDMPAEEPGAAAPADAPRGSPAPAAERGRARDSGRRDDRDGSGRAATADRQGDEPVGQAGRGEFRTRRLL